MSSGPSGKDAEGGVFRQHSGGPGCSARCLRTMDLNGSYVDTGSEDAESGSAASNASASSGRGSSIVVVRTKEHS